MQLIQRLLTAGLLALLITGCSETDKPEVNLDPTGMHSGDECHVCGMLITEWPGPKGESINKQSGETLKFCSTTDLFSWWLQPENRTLQAQIYVHDMAKAHWDNPEDDHLIDGRDAWYVVGTDLLGAMGPTLASFAEQADAQKLADERGGRVLRFADVDLAVLQEIGQAGHEYAASHGRMLRESMGVDDDDEDEHEHEHAH